ncbi:ribosome maturation factor RimP [Peptoniphilaceae bacterium SGI.131]
MKDLIEMLTKSLEPDIEGLGYELVDLEFTKENGENILIFYIYNPNGPTTIEDCERCSAVLDKRLDELDPIKTSYSLSVSSPDLNRPLKNDKDLRRNLGQVLDISLYAKLDNKKNFRGRLLEFDKESISIDEDGNVLKLNRKDISNIKVAIIF